MTKRMKVTISKMRSKTTRTGTCKSMRRLYGL
jgi:hypothetical protein